MSLILLRSSDPVLPSASSSTSSSNLEVDIDASCTPLEAQAGFLGLSLQRALSDARFLQPKAMIL